MKSRILPALCVALSLSVPGSAQYTGTSNFDTLTNWQTPTSVGGGSVNATGGVLEYLALGTSADERGYTYWTLGNAPSDSSWGVMVDVHLVAAPASGDQSVNLNLMVANTAELPGDGNGQNMDQVTISIDRYFNGTGTTLGFESMFNAYKDSVNYHPSSVYAENPVTDASLGIMFDSTSKVVSTYYDLTGSADGQQWTMLQAYSVGTGLGDFGMNWGTDTFTLFLMGASSGNFAVTTGQAYFDNFAVTAVPEPSTYAVILGACALGLVALRRKQVRQ